MLAMSADSKQDVALGPCVVHVVFQNRPASHLSVGL